MGKYLILEDQIHDPEQWYEKPTEYKRVILGPFLSLEGGERQNEEISGSFKYGPPGSFRLFRVMRAWDLYFYEGVFYRYATIGDNRCFPDQEVQSPKEAVSGDTKLLHEVSVWEITLKSTWLPKSTTFTFELPLTLGGMRRLQDEFWHSGYEVEKHASAQFVRMGPACRDDIDSRDFRPEDDDSFWRD